MVREADHPLSGISIGSVNFRDRKNGVQWKSSSSNRRSEAKNREQTNRRWPRRVPKSGKIPGEMQRTVYPRLDRRPILPRQAVRLRAVSLSLPGAQTQWTN